MKRLLAAALLLWATLAYGGWYATNSEKHRVRLIVDPAKVYGSADLTSDFVMLVDVTDEVLKQIQSAGQDIVFTSSDGTTQLYHELESVDTGTGNVKAWVAIGTLDYDDPTTLYMYFGNSSMSSLANADSTWAANYVGVWHLNGTDTTPDDSSGTANHLSENGDPTENATGKIGTGVSVVDNSSWLITPYGNAVNVDSTSLTMCCWFNASSDLGADAHLFAHGNVANNRLYIRIRAGQTNDPWSCRVANGDSGSIGSSATGTWYRACVSADSSANTYLARYSKNAINTDTAFGTVAAFSSNFLIGTGYNITAEGVTGTFDECWLYTGTRTADWLDTEYDNQDSPTTFLSLQGKKEQRARVM